MDLVDGLKSFVATAQTGSFTSAAEQLGISNRLTSKYVAELEVKLGVRLLQRTTRKVGLTPTGQDLLARAPALLEELDDMLGSVSDETRGFTGQLRISAPVTFGEIYIKDLISRFIALHPGLIIDLRLNDANVDLAADGFDLAFRVGTLDVSSLKVRKLGIIKSYVVASPCYLEKHGAPKTPQDLNEHSCIMDTNLSDASRWVFMDGDQESIFMPTRHLLVNSARVARDWAIEGCGIAFCPDFIVAKDISKGHLVPLLKNYETHTHPLSAVYLQGNVLPQKVRALIDFALEDIKGNCPF